MVSIALLVAVQSAQIVDYTPGFQHLIEDLQVYGAYVRDDNIDFDKLQNHYLPLIKKAKTRDDLLPIMEKFVAEFHDFHMSLNTNNNHSPRLVPSGTDLYGIWRDHKAVVEQVRPDSPANKSGVQAGDEIIEIDGLPAHQAASSKLGIQPAGKYGWEWALNSALAGTWDKTRAITVNRFGNKIKFKLEPFPQHQRDHNLTITRPEKGIVVLRPEDSLGENGLIQDVDALVPELRLAKGVIIDLRNTPSGGNSAVARGLMGIFVSKRLPFQHHRVKEIETGTIRDWVEYVTPRLESPIKTRVCVLVSRWTGSMGEGIAIGFDGTKRATVIGTHMAGLRGAVEGDQLEGAGFSLFFPTEQTFHINGTPRHQWLPTHLVHPENNEDALQMALQILTQ
jgi:C-terminal processing protease CtpA/Prc